MNMDSAVAGKIINLITESAEKEFVVVGGNEENSVLKYTPSKKKLIKCQKPPNPCDGSAVASYKKKLYVASGEGNERNIQIYDSDTDTWRVETNVLRTGRCVGGAAIIKGMLYIVAGFDPRYQSLSSIEVFNITADGCTRCVAHSIPSLKEARCSFALVVRGDEMFILGGCDDDNANLQSCEVINTSTNKRYDLPPLNEARFGAAAVLHDDHLVVMGGLQGDNQFLKTVECYSFDTRSWTYLQPLTVPRVGNFSFVYNDKIFAIGGEYRTKFNSDHPETRKLLYSIECYDPATSTWSVYHDIEIPLIYPYVCAL